MRQTIHKPTFKANRIHEKKIHIWLIMFMILYFIFYQIGNKNNIIIFEQCTGYNIKQTTTVTLLPLLLIITYVVPT